MNKFITLLGALTLIVSVSGRASVREDVFNRLDNDSNYNSLTSDEQAVFNNAVDQTLSNLEEKGINLSDADAQMFLLDTIKGFLGLSAGKEDMKKPAMPPAPVPAPVKDMMPAAAAGNSAENGLMLIESNGNYFLLDTITGVIGKVVDAGKNLLGIGSTKPAQTTTGSPSLLGGNSLNGDLSLNENVHYGAITEALKQLGSAVAGTVAKGAEKVKDVLSSKKPAEEPMANPEVTAENSLGGGLMLVDATAQYGAILDAVKNLAITVVEKAKDVGSKVAGAISTVATKVSDKLKGDEVPPAAAPVE